MTDDTNQQLPSNSTTQETNLTIPEELPLSDAQPNPEEFGGAANMLEPVEWTTTRLSEVCREGDWILLRDFTEYSQQTSSCGENASKIADRLDAETGLSPLHHAARSQHLEVCLSLLSHIKFVFGVNIKDENGQTPLHAAFRSLNKSQPNASRAEQHWDMTVDIGNKIQEQQVWIDDYQNRILTSDHPLIYLFAQVGGDVNARDKYLLTPLHYAIARNNLAGVQQLVKLNAEIEASDRQGIRPLHLACREGDLTIVKYLLQQGTQIDAIDSEQWTPLHYACARGHLEIIKLLHTKTPLQFQELIQVKTNTSATCLHLAVQHGNRQTVQFILSQFQGDDLERLINDQAEPFGTPLHFAAKYCAPSMIKLLHESGANPLILNKEKKSALHIACAFNRHPIVQELFALTDSVLIEIEDHQGQTALSLTTNLDIVDELLSRGANIASLDQNQMNAMMIAVTKVQLNIVEHLLSSINDPSSPIFDQVDKKSQRSIFLLAVQTGSIDMCTLLLSNASVRWDTSDKQRMNAFHLAARYNHFELLQFLNDQIRKSDRLLSLKSRSYSVATNTTDTESISPLQSSVDIRPYLDAQNEDGKTPLHIAAERGHTMSVETLIKCGADVLLPNSLGQLPLHVAIQNGHTKCVDLLIKACTRNRADFQAVLSRRQSPLITACQNGYVDIVRLLLSKRIGTEENDKNSDDQEENPLEIAIRYRQTETVHVLIDHSHFEDWLKPVRKTSHSIHQTPLREMIRYMPDCAKHAFDKLVKKSYETGLDDDTHEQITYDYKFIDDYFLANGKLYGDYSHQIYRNHPFIIALDSENHSLLEHPLAQQLIKRKWKLYRSSFYLTRFLTFLLLLILTSYVLIIPSPKIKKTKQGNSSMIEKIVLPLHWIIIGLAAINLLKLIFEILLYRGFRVVFAQLFSIISYSATIIAFIPLTSDHRMTHWQWQLASFAVLAQWFNIAFILRSMPFIGNFIVMFQSTLINFFSLILVVLPLLIAFTISNRMIFHHHTPFVKISHSMHKISAMIIGEFGYETLFYSKPTFGAAVVIFIPFIAIMTIVFMNLLLGVAIGDIQSSMDNARAKAKSYLIRELIYIESTLPSAKLLKSKLRDQETFSISNDSSSSKNDEREKESDVDNEESKALFAVHRQRQAQLTKLLEVITMLETQAKQALEKELTLEMTLRRLLNIQKKRQSIDSASTALNTSR